MNAFKTLEALNVVICKKTGAGKGLATTPEAARAYREELYRRRAEFGAAIIAARRELFRELDRNHGRRYYIDGCESMLESVTHPS
jgi:4'-phosphopantetheinyl transferase EntD